MTPTASTALPETLMRRVQTDLSARLAVDVEQITVIQQESVEWPDAGLGCPLPGQEYDAVSTPGYRIILAAQDERYEYHTDVGQRFLMCDDAGQPVFPSFPVTPGTIDDGDPWMPADPPD